MFKASSMQYLGFVVKLKETTASDRFGFVTQQDGLWEVMTSRSTENIFFFFTFSIPVAYRGEGVWGVQTLPEIPKALQNRAKLNPTVKIVKHC